MLLFPALADVKWKDRKKTNATTPDCYFEFRSGWYAIDHKTRAIGRLHIIPEPKYRSVEIIIKQ